MFNLLVYFDKCSLTIPHLLYMFLCILTALCCYICFKPEFLASEKKITWLLTAKGIMYRISLPSYVVCCIICCQIYLHSVCFISFKKISSGNESTNVHSLYLALTLYVLIMNVHNLTFLSCVLHNFNCTVSMFVTFS